MFEASWPSTFRRPYSGQSGCRLRRRRRQIHRRCGRRSPRRTPRTFLRVLRGGVYLPCSSYSFPKYLRRGWEPQLAGEKLGQQRVAQAGEGAGFLRSCEDSAKQRRDHILKGGEYAVRRQHEAYAVERAGRDRVENRTVRGVNQIIDPLAKVAVQSERGLSFAGEGVARLIHRHLTSEQDHSAGCSSAGHDHRRESRDQLCRALLKTFLGDGSLGCSKEGLAALRDILRAGPWYASAPVVISLALRCAAA